MASGLLNGALPCRAPRAQDLKCRYPEHAQAHDTTQACTSDLVVQLRGEIPKSTRSPRARFRGARENTISRPYGLGVIMPKHPLILAWPATFLLAALIFLAGPLVILILAGALLLNINTGGAAALLSALVYLLWIALGIAVELTLRAAWYWLKRHRCPRA